MKLASATALGALGGVVLAVSGEPQHQRAWARGAEDEEKLARKLERWPAEHGVPRLHDRRMPNSGGHIVRGMPILPPRYAAKLCRADGPLEPPATERRDAYGRSVESDRARVHGFGRGAASVLRVHELAGHRIVLTATYLALLQAEE